MRAAARAPFPRRARTGAARRSGLGHASLCRPAGLPRTAQAELLVGRQVVVAPPNTDPVGALRRAPAGDDARPTRPGAPAARGASGLRLDQRRPLRGRPLLGHGRLDAADAPVVGPRQVHRRRSPGPDPPSPERARGRGRPTAAAVAVPRLSGVTVGAGRIGSSAGPGWRPPVHLNPVAEHDLSQTVPERGVTWRAPPRIEGLPRPPSPRADRTPSKSRSGRRRKTHAHRGRWEAHTVRPGRDVSSLTTHGLVMTRHPAQSHGSPMTSAFRHGSACAACTAKERARVGW